MSLYGRRYKNETTPFENMSIVLVRESTSDLQASSLRITPFIRFLLGTTAVASGPAPSLVLVLTVTEYWRSGFNPPMTVDVELPGTSTVTACLFLRCNPEVGVKVTVMVSMKPLASSNVGSSQDMFMWVPFRRVVSTSLGATVGAEGSRKGEGMIQVSYSAKFFAGLEFRKLSTIHKKFF